MMPPGPQPEYPFLRHPCVSPAMERHYLAWRSFDQGAGVWASIERVTTKLRVSRATVKRNLRRLKAVGLIQAKEQFQDGHQRTNFYTFPTPDWWLEQGGQNDPLISTDDGSDGGRDGRTGDLPSPEPKNQHPSLLPRRRWAPWRLFGRNSPFYTHPDTQELVDHFEDLIQARQVRETGKARKISDDRWLGWIRSANSLLDHHSVEELKTTTTWIFTQWLGILPFQVINRYTGLPSQKLRRVTRLAQVLDHFQEIRDVMERGKPSPSSPEAPPTGVEEVVEIQDQGRWNPRGLSDLGVEESAVEDQVSTLVELFRKTRRHPVSDFDVFGWRKTFRIMLTHRQIPYDDIRLVVNALGNHRLELDFARYHSPYDLHRNGEWPYVLGAVQIALLREKNLPTPAPPPPPPDNDDDDEFYRQLGEEFGT